MQISEMALRYETHSIKNIADLDKVNVTDEVKEENGAEYPYSYIEKDNDFIVIPNKRK